MNKEERQMAINRLAEETKLLLRQSERENLHWKGTRLDLMEALYEVYLNGSIRDDMGQPLPFMSLVRQACTILHVAVPRNPYDCARRGMQRKGLIRPNYLDRYQYLFAVRGNQEPLWEEIY